MARLGVGIVGTGFAQRVQMPALAHVPGARLIGVASGHIENARRAAERFQISHVFDSVEELAAHPDVDLVLISSPPHTHERASAAVVREKKPCACAMLLSPPG